MSDLLVLAAFVVTIALLVFALLIRRRWTEPTGRHRADNDYSTSDTDVLNLVTEEPTTASRSRPAVRSQSRRADTRKAARDDASPTHDNGTDDLPEPELVRPYVNKIDEDVRRLGWFEPEETEAAVEKTSKFRADRRGVGRHCTSGRATGGV